MERRNIQNTSADLCNYYLSQNALFDEELKNEKAKHQLRWFSFLFFRRWEKDKENVRGLSE